MGPRNAEGPREAAGQAGGMMVSDDTLFCLRRPGARLEPSQSFGSACEYFPMLATANLIPVQSSAKAGSRFAYVSPPDKLRNPRLIRPSFQEGANTRHDHHP
jgi:hypothetical protein